MTQSHYWFTLDGNLRRDSVIEGYNSAIWTERYSQYGEFQIVIPSTLASRKQLMPGTMIGMNKSRYTMIADTVDDKTDDDGKRNLTVTGRSFEWLLNDRVAMPGLTPTATLSNWVINGPPADIVNYIFTAVCVNGVISQNDTIPFYQRGTLLTPGGIPLPSTAIGVSLSPDSLYNAAKSICDAYGMGFRMVRDDTMNRIYFEIYMGTDRTTIQTIVNPVVFDETLDNLKDVEYLTSSANVKTVAYVFAQNGAVMVYGTGLSTDVGANRRVLLVNSDNTAVAGTDLNTQLMVEGQLALAAQTKTYAFSGEIPQHISLEYGKDYKLGDYVEERDGAGNVSIMLVTEQIFSSSETGDTSYPTLAISTTTTPGTWLSENPALVWSAVPGTEYWSNAT